MKGSTEKKKIHTWTPPRGRYTDWANDGGRAWLFCGCIVVLVIVGILVNS